MDIFGIYYPPKKGVPNTHVGMMGGKIHVPPGKTAEFMTEYISQVQQNNKLFLVEQCNGETFRFFIDLDYKSDEELNVEEIEDIARKFTKVVNCGNCIIMVAEPKPVGDKIKTGVHMTWYDCEVTLDGAMDIRNEIISKCGYEDAIDISVYKTGIRLPWSHKYTARTKEVGGFYVPIKVITQNGGVRDIDPSPSVEILKLCCIRMPSSKIREGGFSQDLLAKSIDNPDLYIAIQQFVRRFFQGQRNFNVKNIFGYKGGTFLINTDSRYCENKGSIHMGNHIYFAINKYGHVYQKCHCKCEVHRNSGFCSDFTGQKRKLPSHIHDKLFPPKNKFIPLD